MGVSGSSTNSRWKRFWRSFYEHWFAPLVVAVVASLVFYGVSTQILDRLPPPMPATPIAVETEGNFSDACIKFTGTADSSYGWELWAAIGQLSGGYTMKPVGQDFDSDWSVKLTVGSQVSDEPKEYLVTFFYLPQDQSEFISGIGIRNPAPEGSPGSYLAYDELPNGAVGKERVTITRTAGGDGQRC